MSGDLERSRGCRTLAVSKRTVKCVSRFFVSRSSQRRSAMFQRWVGLADSQRSGEQRLEILASWLRRQLRKDILQIGPQFDGVVFATGDQRHQLCGTPAGNRAADEQPVLAADCDGTHRPFGLVVVDRQAQLLALATDGYDECLARPARACSTLATASVNVALQLVR